jgi:Flp pilus assembly protein TadD
VLDGPGQVTHWVAFSHDGRWIATGSHIDTEVKIWDARTGALVRDLGLLGSRVWFSPDGAWLSTTSGGFTLWSVGDWKRAWQGAGDFSSSHAFSPDGRVVAVGAGTCEIVLYEISAGREVARLTDPNGQRPAWMPFSPDQRYLTGISYDFKNLFMWDLHEIDHRLKELGVPWEWPPSKPAPSVEPDRTPLKIVTRVESRSQLFERQLGEVTEQLGKSPMDEGLLFRRGGLLYALDRPDEAIATLTQAIDLAAHAHTFGLRAHAYALANNYPRAITDAVTALSAIGPEDPRQGAFCNQLAWYYVTAPAEFRQPEQALALVRRALRREPERAAYLNTLGVALCRHGDWDESVDALRRSLRAGSDAPASDLYFLAVCFHHLQNERQAREAFEQALYWHDVHEPNLNHQTRSELDAIRDEVQALLGPARDVRQNAEPESAAPP